MSESGASLDLTRSLEGVPFRYFASAPPKPVFLSEKYPPFSDRKPSKYLENCLMYMAL